MADESKLNKETFLCIAKASGLEMEDPHIKDLYDYMMNVLPNLESIEELDLTDVEPMMTFIPFKE
jgi:Asp-tRNA(Asn)/Glu-tRNA(Gln) amidotransferase C subunit